MLSRRSSPCGTSTGVWCRAAALFLGVILLAATLSAGSRVTYCTAMGPFAGSHCACVAQASRTAQAPAVESTDCRRVVTAGALPASISEARAASVPAARKMVFAATAGRVRAASPIAMYTDGHPARQRAGPSPPASAERTRLMVLLL
ncbi:MAG TPA: hypothetical protein VK762_13805 [Polyangiaceae bacterium]|nr:hypothetical protein [Polyangiaceae bacterium]